MATYFQIKNWENFQHYKDRNPPWIKLHRELLTSETWITLDDASRVLAIACMLVAAATGNRIPTNPAYIKRVAYLNADPDFAPLLRAQFIEEIDETGAVLARASKPQAKRTKRLTRDRGETETEERQRRGEAEESSPVAVLPASRSGVRGCRLPAGWMPETFDDWTQGAELAKFRDYWTAQPGQKGVKADWNATWRNWIRRATEYAESRGHSRQGPAKPTSAVERVRQACGLDDDGFPLGPDDGDLRPQVDEQLRDEANGRVVEAPFRVVAG